MGNGIVREPAERKYQCESCEYQETTSGSLNKHKKAIHGGRKYSCELCVYQATTSSTVRKHTQATHERR